MDIEDKLTAIHADIGDLRETASGLADADRAHEQHLRRLDHAVFGDADDPLIGQGLLRTVRAQQQVLDQVKRLITTGRWVVVTASGAIIVGLVNLATGALQGML